MTANITLFSSFSYSIIAKHVLYAIGLQCVRPDLTPLKHTANGSIKEQVRNVFCKCWSWDLNQDWFQKHASFFLKDSIGDMPVLCSDRTLPPTADPRLSNVGGHEVNFFSSVFTTITIQNNNNNKKRKDIWNSFRVKLEAWYRAVVSIFLMLRPFNTVPNVVTPNRKIIFDITS